ncbi:MAG TPA: acetyl-CoA carboxylase carboxyl transferase subunit beta [Lachnospiraceae bacterium]|nr:acetyl-CoA carboxylase carboxyl transferase subunit beta [Lachnospiraceae bacterium]
MEGGERERVKRNDRKRQKAEPSIPDGMWIKCNTCKAIIYKKEVTEYKLCPNCDAHFRMSPSERIAITCDEGTWEELDANIQTKNPLDYPDYAQVIKKAQKKAGILEGVVTGRCKICGQDTVLALMDSHFMMGSMGSVVGEKVTRAVEYATENRLPIIIFTTSGGARMQEGIISLMQMAKVAEALGRHDDAGLLYITVLTDPTTGGVTASFAMLGDIILSEPKALIGFAGQRVIQGTIHQQLPEGFQRAEFQLEHGFVDRIVHREKLREELGKLLLLHSQPESEVTL